MLRLDLCVSVILVADRFIAANPLVGTVILLRISPTLPLNCSSSQYTSVDNDAFTCDEVACSTGKENHQSSQIIRIAPTSGRGSFNHIFVELGIVVKVLGHCSLDKPEATISSGREEDPLSLHLPWANAVTLNSLGSPLIAQRSCHIAYESLATGID